MLLKSRLGHLLLSMLLSWGVISTATAQDPFAAQREALIDQVVRDARATARYIGRTQFSEAVMTVMARVPRHEFVPTNVRSLAYANRPLPIGYGQTISQPYIVALMSDLIDPRDDMRVLEVGTGSGYQAAILAGLVATVYSIEIIEPLGLAARERLARLGYANVTTRVGDGYFGWPEVGPFDAIVVTAAASHVPPPLVAQLKPGGRMVIPVGSRFMVQQLLLVEKGLEGTVTTRQVLPVRFVPLTGGR